MAIVRYGNTWWGQKWVEALNNIDYSNRLPRGQRYARNGSVLSIYIEGNKITSRVSGSRPRPYNISITIPGFKNDEKKKIFSIISANTYYMSQLEGKTLPQELCADLLKEKIKLFPVSWKEMGMRCSCPDGAVPCKHLAAVVYIIANEIDKNPFLVFNLHNYDLVKELHLSSDSNKEEEIISMDSLTIDKGEVFSYHRENLELIDFTKIPEMLSPITRLLTDKPLFYLKGDFRKIISDHYLKMSNAVIKQIKNTDISEELPEIIYDDAKIQITKGKVPIKGQIKTGDKKLEFQTGAMDKLIRYLQVLTIRDLSEYPPVLSFLTIIHSFVLMLIEKSAYIPDIISLDDKSYIIRWIPAIFNNEIKNIYQELCDSIPKEIVRYEKAFLPKQEQVLFIISMLISHYLIKFIPVSNEDDNDMLALFFRSKVYAPKIFQQLENAKTIHLWLARFFVHPKNCVPVIKIDETKSGNNFLFELFIEDRRANDAKLESLSSFMISNNPDKFQVLKDLSLLSTYLPAVNEALKIQKSVEVSSGEFASLWFDALPVLQTLGIKTILPKALKTIFIPELTLAVKQSGSNERNIKTYLQLDSLLDFDWAISAGSTFLSKEEFMELIKNYSGIVRFKDKYIMLDKKEMERIKKQLEKRPSLSPLDILKVNLEESFNNVPVETGPAIKEILQDLFTPKDVSLPASLLAELRPYQLSGFKWLYHNYTIGIGSIIADDMGLGKTIQVIALILKLKETGELESRKILIIVPASILLNWQREIEKFAPSLTSVIYHGQGRNGDSLKNRDIDVIITTYALARMDKDFIANKKWKCLITDEAQNIKNAETSQTRAIKSIKADYRIAMTGTPVENRLMDYWSITDFTMKNLLGSKTSFKENFAIPIEIFNDKKQIDVFRKITAPFILRRMKTDKSIIHDLPDKIVSDQWGQLSNEQTALYQNLVDNIENMISNSEGINRKGIILKLITGLKQICNHPSLYLKTDNAEPELSGKSQLLLDLLQKIYERNEKALIFTQFKEMGVLLEKIIEVHSGYKPLFFHGSLQQKKRNEIIDRFQNDLTSRFLVISLKAGGTGLNLTAANNIIHYDLWWNPAVENQATDRAFRIGQKKNVNVYRFVTKGTFEEKINDMISRKKELADLTVNQGEKWISEMNNKELRELLRLTE
ncbi:MAG: DEAD/DEAH box helicase [Spirochaetia bacterium]|jgi:SNF2 family DNA or RNA helicase/uncharacterized Zn finger protein|nr:DEAD/DEAH box helicase [Spirochaetia bacterium]